MRFWHFGAQARHRYHSRGQEAHHDTDATAHVIPETVKSRQVSDLVQAAVDTSDDDAPVMARFQHRFRFGADRDDGSDAQPVRETRHVQTRGEAQHSDDATGSDDDNGHVSAPETPRTPAAEAPATPPAQDTAPELPEPSQPTAPTVPTTPTAPTAPMVPTAPSAPTTSVASAQYLLEEEKLAGDVYEKFYEMYGKRIFSNIARSEDSHFNALYNQMVKDGMNADAFVFQPAGTYVNPEVQALYDSFLAYGSTSLTAALEVGVMIEEKDIVDLQAASADAAGTELALVYDRLLAGSYNHLNAFEGWLG